MHLLGYCLCFGVWSTVEDAEVSSQTMPAEPSAEFSGYFDRCGCLGRAGRRVGMEVRSQRARERWIARSLGERARERELPRFRRNESYVCGVFLFVHALVLETWPYALDSESSRPYWELRPRIVLTVSTCFSCMAYMDFE